MAAVNPWRFTPRRPQLGLKGFCCCDKMAQTAHSRPPADWLGSHLKLMLNFKRCRHWLEQTAHSKQSCWLSHSGLYCSFRDHLLDEKAKLDCSCHLACIFRICSRLSISLLQQKEFRRRWEAKSKMTDWSLPRSFATTRTWFCWSFGVSVV